MDSIKDILKRRGIPVTETPTLSEKTPRERALETAKSMNELEGNLKGYDCPICRNKGCVYVLRDGTDEIVYRRCQCLKVRQEIIRIKESGLDKLGNKCTFRNFKTEERWQKQIKNAGKAFASEKPNKSWFYIGGQPGSGKTHICTAIGMQLIKEGVPVRYMVWPEEIQKLKAYINDISFESLVNAYKTVDVLYIDDFFKVRKGEKISTADVNMAIRIINHRYNAELVTIISSELSVQQIVELDEALGSRIVEMTPDKYNLYIQYDIRKNYRFNKKGNVI